MSTLKTILALSLAISATGAIAQKAYMEGPDVTGMRDKGPVKMKKQKGNEDTMMMELGNGYFYCGGGSGDWQGGEGLSLFRKGIKSSCHEGPLVLARTSTDQKTMAIAIVEAINITVPKGHQIQLLNCKNADAAILKPGTKQRHTNVIAAWKYVDIMSEPVKDLKKVSCENESFGV